MQRAREFKPAWDIVDKEMKNRDEAIRCVSHRYSCIAYKNDHDGIIEDEFPLSI